MERAVVALTLTLSSLGSPVGGLRFNVCNITFLWE
jgi:hypothetical protein